MRDLRRVQSRLPFLRLQRLVQLREVAGRDMEAGQRVVQAVARHVRYGVVELPQYRPYFMRMLRALDLVVGMGAGDLRDGTPVVPFVVHEEIHPVPRRDDLRQLPDAVRLVLLVLIDLVDMRRHEPNVLHELHRIFEDIRVDPLDDRPRLREHRPVDGQIRVVDIAGSHSMDIKQTTFNLKLFGDDCTLHV